jgi:hypothetical protein
MDEHRCRTSALTVLALMAGGAVAAAVAGVAVAIAIIETPNRRRCRTRRKSDA